MDPLKESREFLLRLSDPPYTLGLVNDRVGTPLLEMMESFAAQAAPEDDKLQHRLAGFMLMGYLLHGHLERREIEERLAE